MDTSFLSVTQHRPWPLPKVPYVIEMGCAPAGAEFRASYSPTGAVIEAAAGSLEHWLTERYCLFTARGGRVFGSDVHHLKWPLQPASAQIERNTMSEVFGLKLPVEEPLLHYAEYLDVVAWRPRRVR